jgi:protocatechuate 3,4-dioxygenase beta subunit
VYSGLTAMSPDGMGRGRGPRKIDETRFLRGVQTSDAQGQVEFATLYPGWYADRGIHIHLKVHLGDHMAHTGQLFFPEELTADIAKLEPYAKRTAVHRTTQDEDQIFRSQHDAASLLTWIACAVDRTLKASSLP